jgi:hypothetical protein
VSVGHVARAIEESGIPTVVIMVKAFEHRAKELRIPRTLVVQHPMGRPLGAASDAPRQDEILDAAFDLAESAIENGTIVEFAPPFRPAMDRN